MSYEEYLKSNGATDDEIKALNVPAARKAFDKMQADLNEQARLRAIAETDRTNYQTWYEKEAVPAFEAKDRELQLAKGNEARIAAVVKERAATDESLREIAKQLGYEVEGSKAAPAVNPPAAGGFDAKLYYTRDEILQIARAESKAIATMGRLVQEHERLFPGSELVDWEGLREQAESSKKPLEAVWMDKYNVATARQAKVDAVKKAEIDAAVAAAVKVKEQELITKFGNPDLRPLSPSNSPFTQRPATGRDKQPWELDKGTLDNDRVTRATQHLISKEVSH